MPYAYDPDVQAELEPLLAEVRGSGSPAVGDVASRRADGYRMYQSAVASRVAAAGVIAERHTVTADDGTALPATLFRAGGPQPGSAALYLHGGGMIIGLDRTAAVYDWLAREYVASSGVPLLVVDYRVAPEHPDPTPVEDCFSALRWLAGHGAALGVDPHRLAVMGDSAGGGLAAGVSLLSRDRGGPPIAAQILIYPMLDDRPVSPDPHMAPFLMWTHDDNRTGWEALLGSKAGGDSVSPYAAPARSDDLSGLPEAYIDVGDLDIFRDEDIDYARRLSAAGVATEFHLHPGCPHAFDGLAPGAAVSQRAFGDRARRLRAL
jgi:acetyl esterase/lipase